MRTLLIIGLFLGLTGMPSARASSAAFHGFLQGLWPQAQALGVTRATFDAATRGLAPDLSLPDLVVPGRPPAEQAEFVQTPAAYLAERTIAALAGEGRRLAAAHRVTLDAIERQFGVPPAIIVAIWGRESGYGRARLPHHALRALATQAFVGRRKEKFRREFLLALRMVEEGQVRLADMRSSWAGAMGPMQFLPSDFYSHAVDFDGDGRRDIWNSLPDALASAAQQLVDKGWRRGQRWGYEVRVPKGVDCTIAEPDVRMPLGEWLRRGFAPAHDRRIGGNDLGADASLLLPAGLYGPGFLLLPNYFVLKDYNVSDLYVLFVAHLADRLAGGRRFETPWGRITQLPSAQVEALQRRLAALNLYHERIDGKAGMKTRAALGRYQKAHGLKLDCWPTAALIRRMQRPAGGE